MKIFVICVIIIIIPSTTPTSSEFVTDFITYYGEHFKVTTFDCKKSEMIYLGKQLTAKGYFNRVLLIQNIKLDYPKPSYRNIFILNFTCNFSHDILKKANEMNLFSSPFHWIMLSQNSMNSYQIQSLFSNLSILIDSDINLCENSANQTVTVRKIFKKHVKASRIYIEEFAVWNRTAKLEIKSNFQIRTNERRKNLGINLNACIVLTNNDSINHLTDRRDKHIDSIAKVNYVLVQRLASIYNISFNFSVKNTWGYKNNESKWSGMMGELTEKRADIGGTSLFLIKERVALIDYIAMISPTRSKFIFRQPKLSYIMNVFILPFDTKVWFSSFGLVLIMMAILFMLMKWEWTKNKIIKIDQHKPHSAEVKLIEVIFMIFGAICQQGVTVLPRSIPGRIATISLLISLMFIYVSYSANIVALLQTSSSSIKTLEDLLNTRIDLGVEDTVYNRFYFKTAEEPTRKAIYEKKVAPPGKPPNFMNLADGVRKIREGLFAFNMETGSGYKLISETFREDEKCGLQEISYLQVVDPWLAIQKNSSYKKMLTIGLRIIQESGIQQRENILIYTRKPVCSTKVSAFFSVDLVDCYFAVAILYGGVLASGVVFILEFCFKHRLKFYKTLLQIYKQRSSMEITHLENENMWCVE